MTQVSLPVSPFRWAPELVEHLQTMHGLDIDGEWRHAPDGWRRNAMSVAALKARHVELHEQDTWNEASERHDHMESVLLSCREHNGKEPFRIELDTSILQDVECTICGYMRTYHPGDELEEL